MTGARSPAIRTCIGCGEAAPREGLLRLVPDPERGLRVDARKRAPGRGAWAHPTPACLERAESMRAIGRAFRGRARPPPPGALVEDARRMGVEGFD